MSTNYKNQHLPLSSFYESQHHRRSRLSRSEGTLLPFAERTADNDKILIYWYMGRFSLRCSLSRFFAENEYICVWNTCQNNDMTRSRPSWTTL